VKNKKYLRKGVAGIFVVFVLYSVMLVFLFAVAIPFLMNMNVQFYGAGQQIMTQSNIQNTIDNIQDADIKTAIQGTFTSATSSTATNIQILGFFFQYSWLWISLIITLILFMITRKTVETQGMM
jgi:hypothetical protein